MAAGAERQPGAAAPEPWQDEPTRRRHVWLTLFRLVVVTVLLGGTAAWQWRSGGQALSAGPLYGIVLVTYLVSLLLALALQFGARLRVLGVVQIGLDVGLATAVVALTGWAESVFVFLFAIAIVDGALLLYRAGAILAAVLSLAVYLGAVLLLAPAPPPLQSIFAQAGALAATAALGSYLSEQLRRTGERLAAREVDLAALAGLHETIVQSMGSGLITLDAGDRVTFLNRAGGRMTAFRPAEVLGRPVGEILPLAGRAEREEVDLVNARGEAVRIGYTIFPLRGPGDEPVGRAVIFQDLTQLRAMEERAQRHERLADLGRVAAGLAHEIRNPLASMTGSIELLRAGAAAGSEDERLMEIVLREAGRLNDLVARFLDYSRPAAPRRGEVDLARVAADTLDVFAHDPAAARVQVERRLQPAPAWCDADQIRQVLWNLLANGAQAAARGGGGRVEVRVGAEPDGAVTLAVEDDGPGIAPQDLPEIFKPFFTTRARGTGLGLATVQRIVDAHQGTVTAESAPGRGARFTVRLPPPAREAG